jgi:hypothetical protein
VVYAAHHFDFLNQTLLPIFLTVRGFLGEGLHSVVHSVLQFLSQIHGREVAFADFLDRFELLMETPLVELPLQNVPPTLQVRLACQAVHTRFLTSLKGYLALLFGEREFEIEVELDGSTADI